MLTDINALVDTIIGSIPALIISLVSIFFHQYLRERNECKKRLRGLREEIQYNLGRLMGLRDAFFEEEPSDSDVISLSYLFLNYVPLTDQWKLSMGCISKFYNKLESSILLAYACMNILKDMLMSTNKKVEILYNTQDPKRREELLKEIKALFLDVLGSPVEQLYKYFYDILDIQFVTEQKLKKTEKLGQ